MSQLVFAYGSLAAGPGRPARLHGHRRTWGVAMDNRVAIPGYKVYRSRADGRRPPAFVAFVDVVPADGAEIDGVLSTVDDEALRALDERERNYDRVDVTEHVPDAGGRVWTYRGKRAARERLRRAVERGRAVVARSYLEAVRSGLAAHGIDAGPDPWPLPVLDLERVDLPATAYLTPKPSPLVSRPMSLDRPT